AGGAPTAVRGLHPPGAGDRSGECGDNASSDDVRTEEVTMTTQQEQAQPTEQETERTEQAIERGPTTGAPARRGGYGGAPFSLFRRLSDDIDRLFGAFFGQNFRWPERLTSPRGLMETTSWP